MLLLSCMSGAKRPFLTFRPAFEILEDRLAPATFTVNTTLDELTPGDPKLSLREAITKANNHDNALNLGGAPDVIVLPAGVYKMALAGADQTNAAGDFDITESVTIKGQGAGTTVIDGAKVDRLFDLLGAINLTFASLTMRNGGPAGVHRGALQALDAHLGFVNRT